MDMSKSTPGGVGKGTSGETPGVKSEEDSGYLDMHPVGQSLPTVREKAGTFQGLGKLQKRFNVFDLELHSQRRINS